MRISPPAGIRALTTRSADLRRIAVRLNGSRRATRSGVTVRRRGGGVEIALRSAVRRIQIAGPSIRLNSALERQARRRSLVRRPRVEALTTKQNHVAQPALVLRSRG